MEEGDVIVTGPAYGREKRETMDMDTRDRGGTGPCLHSQLAVVMDDFDTLLSGSTLCLAYGKISRLLPFSILHFYVFIFPNVVQLALREAPGSSRQAVSGKFADFGPQICKLGQTFDGPGGPEVAGRPKNFPEGPRRKVLARYHPKRS